MGKGLINEMLQHRVWRPAPERLLARGIETIVDVRLRPDRARLGTWVKTINPDKGIEKLLAEAGIGYVSLIELGNLFLEFPDWESRYQTLLDRAGDLLTDRLSDIPQPFNRGRHFLSRSHFGLRQ